MRHTCTRSQSIAEAKLLDVSDQAHTFGFRVPGHLIGRVVRYREWGHCGFQDETWRLADVLSLDVASVRAPAEHNAITRQITVYRTSSPLRRPGGRSARDYLRGWEPRRSCSDDHESG